MAEKIIEMSKMAPFGLPTPTEADWKSIESPSKKFKAESQHKLWTHEARMINEKIIYLNKSTTKYVIMGNDCTTFEATMKICDRTNGSHITLTASQETYFQKIVDKLISNHEYDADLESCSGVEITKLRDGIWKFKEKIGFGSIVLQKISLENFLYSGQCIANYMFNRYVACDAYKKSLMEMRSAVVHLDGPAKKRRIQQFIDTGNVSLENGKEDENKRIKHFLANSIICSRPYLQTLEEYRDFY